MSVNREELKRMIDYLREEETIEVIDFIGYLNMKRDREELNNTDVNVLSNDENLINQVLKSRKNRVNNQVYNKEKGLEYLNSKVEEFESEQNL